MCGRTTGTQRLGATQAAWATQSLIGTNFVRALVCFFPLQGHHVLTFESFLPAAGAYAVLLAPPPKRKQSAWDQTARHRPHPSQAYQ
jgi:hypothetical protein